ncbi:MAG: TRAP transporter substrate-binding protein [Betaproteobacteria bacterium]
MQSGSAGGARWQGRQFHNQPEDSHIHGFLVALWDGVRKETAGRVDISVHPRNGDIAGSDPGALKMLVAGQLEFMTLMGGILGQVVPAAEIQGLPFAFGDTDQVFGVMDGPLGDYLNAEMHAKGIHGLPGCCFENGFRQIYGRDKPVRSADDLAGYRMRVPDGRLFVDAFTALGAVPVIVNIKELYESLKSGRVDGQENALVVHKVNRLYEVTKYLSVTKHMWSGFNLLANLAFWKQLPADVQDIIQRNARRQVLAQRAHTRRENEGMLDYFRLQGMVVNETDTASFRARLAGDFYRRWKNEIGAMAWNLLEAQVGRLGS